MRERRDIGKAEPHQVGQRERPKLRDVPERVAPDIAIFGGVGQFANAHAIEHDPNDS